MIDIEALNKQFENASATDVLAFFLKEFHGEIALSSSLRYEDQMLTDMISKRLPAMYTCC